ncbi:hypothetical protein L3X38_027769 [Prunus dulcis]|uniref:Uncharacterized protein n=1 Tax=Prunus dulcis TaxID=3755 RepID=A0AAD4YZS7_PRUDU|nr:hypothetical protein L3X38_027769 [Prunus dulcis]
MDQHKTDDNLRYVGGLTPVLAADASISFTNADDDDFSIAKGAAALDDLTDDDIRMAIQMLMVQEMLYLCLRSHLNF